MSLVQIQFRLGLDGLLLANEVRNKVAPLKDPADLRGLPI